MVDHRDIWLGGKLYWAWRSALALFVLAAATGVLYRFMLAYGFTWGLNLVNVRHAHSHLMYFGWVTPALVALIGLSVRPREGGHQQTLATILLGCVVSAVIAYPLFLTFGYSLVAVGTARMPIAVIGSTLNMIPWVAFIVWYRRRTAGLTRTPAIALWDASLVFLALAIVGAGMLALLKPLGIDSDRWAAALTHVFLDYFSEGWFVLALLGLAHRELSTSSSTWARTGLYLLCLGVPLTFALGMPSVLVPQGLAAVARIGAVLLAGGLLINVALLWRGTITGSHRWWRIPLALLAIKALMQLMGAVTPGVWWSDFHGLRILYLHLMLLGFVSLGLVAAARAQWGIRFTGGSSWFAATVILVLVSLIPLSAVWPSEMGGRWTFVAAAWIGLLPVLAMLAMLVRGFRQPAAPAHA